jgi:hypothetical protein
VFSHFFKLNNLNRFRFGSVKMSGENLVFVAKATIKVQFPEGYARPGYLEMLKFAFELGLEADEIYSIYQE